jgi:uncharacterized protein with PIN domain
VTCLDAWAVLAWLQGEQPAAQRVGKAMDGGSAVMSWVNAGEVAYIMERRHGPEARDRVVAALRARLLLEEPPAERVLQAAAIKAAHPVSYAGAFAIATAGAHQQPLLTGDPEILAVLGPEAVVDLRPGAP